MFKTSKGNFRKDQPYYDIVKKIETKYKKRYQYEYNTKEINNRIIQELQKLLTIELNKMTLLQNKDKINYLKGEIKFREWARYPEINQGFFKELHDKNISLYLIFYKIKKNPYPDVIVNKKNVNLADNNNDFSIGIDNNSARSISNNRPISISNNLSEVNNNSSVANQMFDFSYNHVITPHLIESRNIYNTNNNKSTIVEYPNNRSNASTTTSFSINSKEQRFNYPLKTDELFYKEIFTGKKDTVIKLNDLEINELLITDPIKLKNEYIIIEIALFYKNDLLKRIKFPDSKDVKNKKEIEYTHNNTFTNQKYETFNIKLDLIYENPYRTNSNPKLYQKTLYDKKKDTKNGYRNTEYMVFIIDKIRLTVNNYNFFEFYPLDIFKNKNMNYFDININYFEKISVKNLFNIIKGGAGKEILNLSKFKNLYVFRIYKDSPYFKIIKVNITLNEDRQYDYKINEKLCSLDELEYLYYFPNIYYADLYNLSFLKDIKNNNNGKSYRYIYKNIEINRNIDNKFLLNDNNEINKNFVENVINKYNVNYLDFVIFGKIDSIIEQPYTVIYSMHGYIYTLSYPKNPTEKIIIAHGYNIIYPKNSEYKIKSVENVMQKEFFKINNIQIDELVKKGNNQSVQPRYFLDFTRNKNSENRLTNHINNSYVISDVTKISIKISYGNSIYIIKFIEKDDGIHPKIAFIEDYDILYQNKRLLIENGIINNNKNNSEKYKLTIQTIQEDYYNKKLLKFILNFEPFKFFNLLNRKRKNNNNGNQKLINYLTFLKNYIDFINEISKNDFKWYIENINMNEKLINTNVNSTKNTDVKLLKDAVIKQFSEKISEEIEIEKAIQRHSNYLTVLKELKKKMKKVGNENMNENRVNENANRGNRGIVNANRGNRGNVNANRGNVNANIGNVNANRVNGNGNRGNANGNIGNVNANRVNGNVNTAVNVRQVRQHVQNTEPDKFIHNTLFLQYIPSDREELLKLRTLLSYKESKISIPSLTGNKILSNNIDQKLELISKINKILDNKGYFIEDIEKIDSIQYINKLRDIYIILLSKYTPIFLEESVFNRIIIVTNSTEVETKNKNREKYIKLYDLHKLYLKYYIICILNEMIEKLGNQSENQPENQHEKYVKINNMKYILEEFKYFNTFNTSIYDVKDEVNNIISSLESLSLSELVKLYNTVNHSTVYNLSNKATTSSDLFKTEIERLFFSKYIQLKVTDKNKINANQSYKNLLISIQGMVTQNREKNLSKEVFNLRYTEAVESEKNKEINKKRTKVVNELKVIQQKKKKNETERLEKEQREKEQRKKEQRKKEQREKNENERRRQLPEHEQKPPPGFVKNIKQKYLPPP